MLLSNLMKRPSLGKHVKRLEELDRLFCRFAYGSVPALAVVHWAISLVRHCPDIVRISVWPDLEVGWPAELERLPHLRELVVSPRLRDETSRRQDLAAYFDFLTTLPWNRLRLSSARLYKYRGRASGAESDSPALLRIPAVELYLVECCVPSWSAFGLSIDDVRTLSLCETPRPWLSHNFVLPRRLDAFSLRAARPVERDDDDDRFYWSVGEWVDLFAYPERLWRLRTVHLSGVHIDSAAFSQLCAAAPNLEVIDMSYASWYVVPHDRDGVDVEITVALCALVKLRYVHLGKVPQGSLLRATPALCARIGVELEWYTPTWSPLRWVASPALVSDAGAVPSDEEGGGRT